MHFYSKGYLAGDKSAQTLTIFDLLRLLAGSGLKRQMLKGKTVLYSLVFL